MNGRFQAIPASGAMASMSGQLPFRVRRRDRPKPAVIATAIVPYTTYSKSKPAGEINGTATTAMIRTPAGTHQVANAIHPSDIRARTTKRDRDVGTTLWSGCQLSCSTTIYRVKVSSTAYANRTIARLIGRSWQPILTSAMSAYPERQLLNRNLGFQTFVPDCSNDQNPPLPAI